MTIPATHLVPLAICLAIAAGWDLFRRRIPNALSVSVATLGIGVQIFDGGLLAALSGVAAGMLAVAVLYRPWLAGGVGGGDVKLAAAVATWVGLGGLPAFALSTAIVGGAVAAICYLASGRTARQQIGGNLVGAVLTHELPIINQRTASAEPSQRVSVPYGIAVAVGGLVALWRPWL